MDMQISSSGRGRVPVLTLGNVTRTENGNDLNFGCSICGAEEIIIDGVDSGRPTKFIWRPASNNGTAQVGCNSCGTCTDLVDYN